MAVPFPLEGVLDPYITTHLLQKSARMSWIADIV